jgi:hypothetical protein
MYSTFIVLTGTVLLSVHISRATGGTLDLTTWDLLRLVGGFVPWDESSTWSIVSQSASDLIALGGIVAAWSTQQDPPPQGPFCVRDSKIYGLLCFFALLAAATTVRTLLHIPYLLLALVTMQLWAFGKRSLHVDRCWVRLVLGYTAVHLLTDYAMQLPFVAGAQFQDSDVAVIVGLKPLPVASAQFWLNVGLRFGLFALYGASYWRQNSGTVQARTSGDSAAEERLLPDDSAAGDDGASGSSGSNTASTIANPAVARGAVPLDPFSGAGNVLLKAAAVNVGKIAVLVTTLLWALAVHPGAAKS